MPTTKRLNFIPRPLCLGLAPALAAITLIGCGGGGIPVPSSSSSSSSVPNSSSVSSSVSSGGIAGNDVLVYAINAGGNTAATLDGVEYTADRFATGGTTQTITATIAGASDSKLYQTERYGAYSYEVPVTAATYSVKMHFVEMYHETAGARSFSVTVEGQSALENVDLFSLVGRNGAYEYVIEDVPVSDGKLTVTLTTQTDNATISGIAIYSADGGEFEEPPTPVCNETERQQPRMVNYATEFTNQQYFDGNVARAPSGPRGFVIEQATATLRNHTIYRPQTLMDNDNLPIVVWGNGACSNDGLSQADFLSEIASHGYIAIANGAPGGGGTNDGHETELVKAIDWAIAENGRACSQFYGKLNIEKIASMGWSCGGGMAHYAAVDPRVDTGVALNSGLGIYGDRQSYYSRFHAPMAIFNGNSSDVAYNPGLQEYDEVTNVPIYHANHANLGHGDAYFQNNGGDMGKAAVGWLNFQLKGDMGATGRGLFFDTNCFMCRSPWTSKNKGF